MRVGPSVMTSCGAANQLTSCVERRSAEVSLFSSVSKCTPPAPPSINAFQIEMFGPSDEKIQVLLAGVSQGYLVQAHVAIYNNASIYGCPAMEDAAAAFLVGAGDYSCQEPLAPLSSPLFSLSLSLTFSTPPPVVCVCVFRLCPLCVRRESVSGSAPCMADSLIAVIASAIASSARASVHALGPSLPCCCPSQTLAQGRGSRPTSQTSSSVGAQRCSRGRWAAR